MPKTIEEINKKIETGEVKVVTADEMSTIVKDEGPENAAKEVDVVTTGTFGAMCSSGIWLNFGHSDPPIKMKRIWLNDVEAYAGVAAVDAYIGATQPSKSKGIEYGGGHVIEDLVANKPVVLRAEGARTDCYPRKSIETLITINDLNQAIMSNPRNAYQRYNVATNSTDKILYTYMGMLLPNYGNATFCGAGELSPIMNDPEFETIGIGTKIFLCGAQGYIVWHGTQHDPQHGFSTLMVQGNLKHMTTEFLRGATFHKYGCTLYVGIGVPIPILNEQIAKNAGIRDSEILTNVLDYGVGRRTRPTLRKVSYEELKSGRINIGDKDIPVSPISSYFVAKKVADTLKNWIENGDFYLSQHVERLPVTGTAKPMAMRKVDDTAIDVTRDIKPIVPKDQSVIIDDERCINCGLCVSICSSTVFSFDHNWKVKTAYEKCTVCRSCINVCPHNAISTPVGDLSKEVKR